MNISIRIKILLSISLGCVLLLAQTLITSYFIKQQQVNVSALANAAEGRLFIDLLRDSAREAADKADAVGKSINRDQALESLSVYLDDVLAKLNVFTRDIASERLGFSAEDAAGLAEIISTGMSEFREFALDEDMEGEDISDAAIFLNDPLYELIEQLNFVNKEYAEHINEAMAAEKAARNKPVHYGFVIFILSTITLLIFAWYFSGKMLKTIRRSLNRANRISMGDLSEINDNQKHSNDELGHLDDSLSSMTSSLRNLVREIIGSSGELVSAANALAKIATNSQERATNQSEKVRDIKESILSLSNSASSIAQASQETVQASEDATKETAQSLTVANQMTGSMSVLSNDMQNIVNAIDEFSKRVSDIENILTVITGISEQTNLLALNASIEAARAGEQGRGFAVVADEVRSLAQGTQSSARDIKTIIDDVRRGVDSIVKASCEVRDKTDETSNIAGNAGDSIKVIIDFIHSLDRKNIEIASAVTEQNNLIQSITGLLEKVTENEVLTLDSANATTEQSQHLALLSNNLCKKVETFKT